MADFDPDSYLAEENDEFSPENYTEGAEPSLSALEAGLEGAGQSVSFGFAEELTAPLAAGAAILAGDAPKEIGESGLDRLQRLMQSYRDIARERTKTAAEERPYSFGAGALAGGVLLPGAAGAKASTAFGKIAQGAATGSVGGGLSGLGMAEGELPERLDEAATMAGLGATVGAAIPAAGATISLLGKGAGALRKKIADSDVGKIFKLARKEGDIPSQLEDEMIKLKDLGADVTSQLLKKTAKERAAISKAAEKATESGKIINTQQLIGAVNEIAADLPDSVSKNRILKSLESFIEENPPAVTPTKAFSLFKELKRNMKPSGKDIQERAIFKEMDTAMKNVLSESIEELPDRYKNMSELLSMYQAMSGKDPGRFKSTLDQLRGREKMARLLAELEPEARERTMMEEILRGFKGTERAGETVKGMRQIAPEIAEQIETQAPQIAEKIRLGLSLTDKEIKTVSPSLRGQLTAMFGGGAGILEKGAHLAGKTAKSLDEMSSNLIKATPEELTRLAQNLSKAAETGGAGAKEAARIVNKVLTVNDRSKRKALLFSLMQRPELRESIKNAEEMPNE